MATNIPGIKNTVPDGVPQATKDYVNQQITNYLATVSTVDIVAKNGVSIISTVTGTNKTVVDLEFLGTVSDLSDTNITTPITTNHVLQWNGTSWIAGAGTAISDASITDLSDVTSPLGVSSFLITNSAGTSVIYQPTSDYLQTGNLVPGEGILKTDTGSTTTISLELSQVTPISTHSSGDFFVVTDSNNSNANARVLGSNIGVSSFNNDANYISPSGITINNIGSCATALSVTSAGSNITFDIDLSEYLDAPGGILQITAGGTSASTASGARTNLGVSYNSDIIQYREGRFQETLLGDMVRLVSPGMSAIDLVSGGTLYPDGTSTRYVQSVDLNPLYFTATASGGAITGVSTISGTCGFPHLYQDLIGVSVFGTTGTSATVNVYAKKSYINFGQTAGEDGIGFRMNNGDIEVRNQDSSTWNLVNQGLSVQDLTDVNIIGSEGVGNFLIYSGTCYQNRSITGDISINYEGVASFNFGGISPQTIGVCPSYSPITPAEFSQLSGMSQGTGNTIQEQLNRKIQLLSSQSAVNGAIVYYDTSQGTFPEYSQLTLPSGTSPFVVTRGTSGPQYQDVYHAFQNSTAAPPSGVCAAVLNFALLDSSSELGERYNFSQVATALSSEEGGLVNVGNQISLDFSGVSGTSTMTSDSVFAYTPPSGSGFENPSKITLADLCETISGSGVCGGIVPGKVTSRIESGPSPADITGPYENQLCFFTNVAGTSYLGVYDGSGWLGAALSAIP